MYFLSLKLFEVLKFIQFLMLFENQFLDTSSNFERQKTDRWLPSPIYFYLFLLVIYFLIFSLPYQQLPLELADKVIENQKEVHRMTFLSPYVLPVAQVVWGVEIHSIPHVIWKSISWHLIQFWAPKNRSMIAFHRSIFIYFCWLFIFWFFNYLISNFLWSWLIR